MDYSRLPRYPDRPEPDASQSDRHAEAKGPGVAAWLLVVTIAAGFTLFRYFGGVGAMAG